MLLLTFGACQNRPGEFLNNADTDGPSQNYHITLSEARLTGLFLKSFPDDL